MSDTKAVHWPQTNSRRRAPQSPIPTDERVAREARQRLSGSSYFALRCVSCECHEDMFVLRGKVPSFYMKQVAQEMVRDIEGVGAIGNALEVAD